MMVKIIKYLPNPEATLLTTVYRKTLIHESIIYKGYLAHFLTSALKKFLILFPKKTRSKKTSYILGNATLLTPITKNLKNSPQENGNF